MGAADLLLLHRSELDQDEQADTIVRFLAANDHVGRMDETPVSTKRRGSLTLERNAVFRATGGVEKLRESGARNRA